MKTSESRFLTTHVGSLVRPVEIVQIMRKLEAGETTDLDELERLLPAAVEEVVRQQVEAGVDIPSDGEFGKRGWTGYVAERLEGLEVVDTPYGSLISSMAGSEGSRFAGFYEAYNRIERTMWLPGNEGEAPSAGSSPAMWQCTGPIRYIGGEAVKRDIDNLKAAMQKAGVEEGFLPVAAPASVTASRRNNYYKTDEEYIYAVADALSQEYHAIADAGLLLQVDDAFLPVQYRRMPEGTSLEEYHRFAAMTIEALNHALKGTGGPHSLPHLLGQSKRTSHLGRAPG